MTPWLRASYPSVWVAPPASMEYMLDSSKEYVGEVCLGVSTNSYDAEGEITRRDDPSGVTMEKVEDILQGFLGRIEQVPPMFSALKRQGKRLYELARQGIEVERDPRPMTVHSIRLADWNPPVATVRIECSRGFYMRSLAHDIGVRLGCGAHLQSLRRLRTGPLSHLRLCINRNCPARLRGWFMARIATQPR